MSQAPFRKTLLTKNGKQCGKFIEVSKKRSSNVTQSSNTLQSNSTDRNSIFSSSVELEKLFAGFQLPDFSKVQKKLTHGMLLNSEERKIVAADLGDAIRKFTHYPLVEQLHTVVEIFLKKYPHLLETCKPEICKKHWVRVLQEHFVEFGIKMSKNMKNGGCEEKRKRSERCKGKVDEMTQTSQHAVYQDLSLVIQEMKQEWLEPVRNTDLIERFMRITYDTRRSLIVHEKPKIYVLKERYPALFDVVGIKKEFLYNIGKDQVDVFDRNLKQFSKYIFDLSANKFIKNEILISCTKRNQFVDKRIIPILLIPSLLGENLDFLCFSNMPFDKEDILPRIECKDTLQDVLKGVAVYRIYVENMLICEPRCLTEAMFCLVACYWAFFIEYPSKSSKTLQIFQTLFLEVEEYYEEEEISLNEDVVKLADLLKGLQRKKMRTK